MTKHINVPILAALVASVLLFAPLGRTQATNSASDFTIALPTHPGQLQWHGDGFIVTQMSVESKAEGIGIRAQNPARKLLLCGFLIYPFGTDAFDECQVQGHRDGIEKRSDTSFKAGATSELVRPGGSSIALINYEELGNDRKPVYSERAFIAAGDTCGDLEFYTNTPINNSDPTLKKIWQSIRFNPAYQPKFDDIFQYAQLLFESQKYDAAGPLFELALTKLKDDGNSENRDWRRVATDQAGMSYGAEGDIPKARAILDAAVAKDPDYPMYYYNLACADAAQNKLDEPVPTSGKHLTTRQTLSRARQCPTRPKMIRSHPTKRTRTFGHFYESLH